MTEIPSTAREFRAWLAKHKDEMSPDLFAKAERVRLSLDGIAMNRQPAAREALARASADDIKAFADAWERHREDARSGE